MSVRYSYDDFTTRGHGVIEGYWGGNNKPRKKKNSKRKSIKPVESKYTPKNHKENVDQAYKHFIDINRTSREI